MGGEGGRKGPGDQPVLKDSTRKRDDAGTTGWNIEAVRGRENALSPEERAGRRLSRPPSLDKAHRFENLRKYAAPEKHQAALKAQKEYADLSFFEDAYWRLTSAAADSTLEVDKLSGDLRLSISGKSARGLLSRTMIDQAKGKVQGAALDIVLGKRVAAFLGLAKDAVDMKKRLESERLVGKVTGEAGRERFEMKVKLLTTMVAHDAVNQLHRKVPSSVPRNPHKISIYLENTYWKFENAYKTYGKLIHEDEYLRLKHEAPDELRRRRREPDKIWQG